MLMLRAAASKAKLPTAVFRRHLGDSTRGPGATNFSLATNAKYAREFFTKGAISYAEYKQQCQSLRVFVFIAAVAYPVAMLALSPPKSSYWATYSPGYWITNINSFFFPPKQPVFLSAKVERETDVKEIHQNLVMFRTLPASGEEED